VPVYFLYEMSILISTIELKRKAKREMEEALLDQQSN
jgi:Sec-independent protein secretion pathway component TatC